MSRGSAEQHHVRHTYLSFKERNTLMSSVSHDYHSSHIEINRVAADAAGAAGGGMVGSAVGVAVGHLAGAKLGAVVGTAMLPGLGTIIGAYIGVKVARWLIEEYSSLE
jgi:hypothetical protein